LSALGGIVDEGVTVLSGIDRPRSVCRVFVTPHLFDVLGAQPIRGRLLADGDFADAVPAAALVTDLLWRSYLGSDPGVVGRAVHLDEQAFTIVGVVPADVVRLLQQRRRLFDEGTRDRCVITPLARGREGEVGRSNDYDRQHRDSPWLKVVGRLREGVGPDSARADLGHVAERLRARYRPTNAKRGLTAVPLDTWRTTEVTPLLMMLAVAAALAFLVACANAAGIVLVENVRREPDLAVRQALGAGPSQLLRVVLVRSVLWSLPGIVVGFAFGHLTLALVRWGASATGERLGTISIGAPVLAAGFVLTLVAGLATGGVAAWSMRRHNVTDSLREGGYTTSTGRRRHRATTALVAVQVAAAMALAMGAALLLHSMWNVISLDRGFDLDRGFVVQVRLPRSRYPRAPEQAKFYWQALARVRALPGVTVAGVSASPPLTDTVVSLSGDLAVETPAGRRQFNRLAGQLVSSGYLEALKARRTRGRLFTPADEQTNAPVVVVDEAFRRKYLAGMDPLACALRWGRSSLAIIGVVADVRQSTERDTGAAGRANLDATAYLLLPRVGGTPKWSFLVVRTAGNPAMLADAVVRELLAVDSAACLGDARTFSQLFASKIAERRRILGLLGGFTAIVLLLTALSLASALAQFVSRHTRDIAIRIAIGGSRWDVIKLTGRQIGLAFGSGLVLGGVGGLFVARALGSQLYGLEFTDPSTLAATVGTLLVLALVAAAGPAWKACRVDPASALRAL
jgi:predicted permease